MTFLDFGAAFDTVDHNTFIRNLKTEYGIGGIALNWFKSYLSNRSYKVKIKTHSQMLNHSHLGFLRTQYNDLFYTYYMLKTLKK